MDLQLTNKVAIVTGGSRGLGLASARALIAEGCHVAICARGAEQLEKAAEELRQAAPRGARVVPITADVATADGVQRFVDTSARELGGVDIVVNNVGLARGGGIEDTSDVLWQEAIDQTLYSSIRTSRLAVPHLKQRGGGTIVIVSSIFGREAGGRMTY